MRHSRSLAGFWQFQLDPEGDLTVHSLAPDREIKVPLPWQAAFPELRQYGGYAWYRCHLDMDEDLLQSSGNLLLRFGAVDYWCQVYVNGTLAGEHEGGYTPFTIPIRHQARPGRNEIAVRVFDPVQTGIYVSRWPSPADQSSGDGPPFDAHHVPHGKQDWYINAGGIWQDVHLIAVPAAYIDRLQVTPDIHTGEAKVVVELGGDPAARSGEVRVTVRAAGGAAFKTTVRLEPGQRTCATSVAVARHKLWSPDSPHLYTATAHLRAPGGQDELSTRFGFREITTHQGQLLLNGEPFFLLSALDQDFYPETVYTVPSEAFLRDQFHKAKALGFNNLRCHIKPPDPLYLDLADEMGLTVWEEVPSWNTLAPKDTRRPADLKVSPDVRRRVAQTLEHMVRRDYNHPSLIIWTIVNEDWGTSLPFSPDDRRWVVEMYDLCKQLDPTRLVVDNSACPAPWGPNFHVKSDLDDFHIYANIPDQARAFESTIEQLNLRPGWTYSAHGDAQRTHEEPLILSEFGNWALPSPGVGGQASGVRALQQTPIPDRPPLALIPLTPALGPWWSRWEGDPGWPEGAEERFERLGLDAIWGDYQAFAEATQWHQFAALKFQIETLRRQSALKGYVVTELADAYWEANGLLDFLRNPKANYDLFPTVNAPDVIIAHVERYAYWDDEVVKVALHGSHFSGEGWSGAQVRWASAAGTPSGQRAIPAVPRGSAAPLGTANWHLPRVEQTRPVSVELSLHVSNDRKLAVNSLDLLVLPSEERAPRYKGTVTVMTREEALAPPPPDVFGLQAIEPLEGEPHGVALHDTPLPDTGEEEAVQGVGAVREPPLHSDLARSLRGLGYNTTGLFTPEARLAVATFANPKLLRWVRDGGNLLYITRGLNPFFWAQGRGGTYGGNWISAYSWLRPGVYRRLGPVSSPLGMPFLGVMPPATILGLPVENPAVQGDFLAGMVSGWVAHPAVHTVRFRYGLGRVIMTTFHLDLGLPRDPVAVAMLHDLIEHLTSDACRPTLEL